jgi:uncharacterized membrane protein
MLAIFNSMNIMFIFYWWFTIFIIGISFLPLTLSIFKEFFDKGYIFSKILGISVLTYAIFLFGTFHALPFLRIISLLLVILFFLINYSFLLMQKRGEKRFISIKNISLSLLLRKWKLFLFEEILFIAALFFWAIIKSYQPDIHGLEKYMDFGFVNSILRSEYFPAKDLWLTPFSINYYYFGHLVTAVLTKISSVPSNISFNLMLATLFSLTFVGSFSIGINLIKTLFAKKTISNRFIFFTGFLTAFLVTLGGNLHTIFAFFRSYSVENPVPFWKLDFLFNSFPNAYWYPNATRFIRNTIHEFPIYSWVVSDLHGHVLDIPFVLFTIALLFSIFLKLSQNEILNEKKTLSSDFIRLKKINPKVLFSFEFLSLVLLGFILSTMYMTNAWDGAIYLLFALLIFFFMSLRIEDKAYLLFNFLSKTAIVFIAFIIFSSPFNFFFKPFVSGIGLLCAPDFLINFKKLGPFLFEANHCQTSPLWQLLILYGFFYFLVGSFFVLVLKTKSYKNDFFVILLVMLSTILIFIPEIIYVKDIYPAHFRANTMFKLSYQAFILLSISSAYIVARLFLFFREQKNISVKIIQSLWFFIFILLFSLIISYPFFAIKSYYNNLETYQGLDGTKYLETLYPNDYQAILWLNKNIKNQPVILEAQGDSYTDYGRISINTGLPTILGWTVHEWLWRGSYDIPAPRIEQVKTLYETTDINKTKELIKKYNIKLVFVGELEKQKYQDLKENKFKEFGKIIYSNSKVNIYEINL